MQPFDPSRPTRQEGDFAVPKLMVVYDQPQECPYLDGVTARMPLQLPVGRLDGAALDLLLSQGFRRTGDFVYRTQCPSCQACEPTRVPVETFVWTKSLQRVLKRGDAELTVEFGPVNADEQRVRLFNRHRNLRQLDRGDGPVDPSGYSSFLVDSCCPTIEMSVRHGDQLISISVIDVGQQSLSAVYTHFDPDFSRFSLGTYAILKQIQRALETGRTFVYLGMYVAQNQHLNYKARFVPQERFIHGNWEPR